MVREKVTKKKGHPSNSESTEYETGSDGEVYIKPKRSTKKGMSKRNVQGRGASSCQWRGMGVARGSRGRSSSALADPSYLMDEPGKDVDLSYL
jgi:hypothetical protein